MKKILFAILAICLLYNYGITQSTSKEELERKKRQLLEEIEESQQLLSKTRNNKNLSLNEVYALKKKIVSRQKLIANYNAQLSNLQNNIGSTQRAIRALDVRLDSLKSEYGRLVVKTYKTHGDLDKVLFIFSAKDFNDAYHRYMYMKQYSDYRQKQAELIQQTKTQRIGKLKDLELQKNEKKDLLGKEFDQKQALENEKKEKDKVINSLKGQENQLLAQIKEKKKATAKLNKLIEDLIKKEIEDARKKSDPGASSSKVLALTPEAKLLNDNFEANQGKLPWPVERGMIVAHFGVSEHEVLDKVKVNNNGVDIKTSPGATVRAVFDGTVVKTLFNPSFQKAILVNHGLYFTVYSNLEEVFVKSGDKIKTKDPIGKVYTNNNEDKTEVHLEIWKNTTKLNPENWLLSRY
jgi:septal ring factor EnvC (AmiA/AmiB activator)